MNEWRDATLGDVLTLQRGFDLTEREATPGPFPVISSGGSKYTSDSAKVDGPGVITGRKGVLGKVHWSEGPFWPHDTTLWVKDFKGSYPRFVYYLLQTLPLAALDAGAANPTLNRNHAHLLPVRVPASVTTQVAIADTLRSFDDLIENNRRRVEVLEEMARAIYREWFVKFRYPGYQDVPLVESALGPIPRGWAARRLDEVAIFRGGSTRTKAAYVDAGFVAFSAAGPDGFVPDYEFDGPGVVLSAVGARCGRTFWASGKWSSIANTIKIIPNEPDLLATWLLFATEDTNIWPKRGSAQPFVSINDARGVLTVAPARETHLRFEEAARPMIDQAVTLRAAIQSLARLRDLLLPKLVAGQIDVSTLNLDAQVEEVVA